MPGKAKAKTAKEGEKVKDGECPVLDVGPENSSSYTSSELSESEEEALPLPPVAKATVAAVAKKAPPPSKGTEKCQSVSSSSDVSTSDSEAEIPQKATSAAADRARTSRLSPTISPPRLRQAMAGKRHVDTAILDRYHQVFCT